jgi:hypothetical protein
VKKEIKGWGCYYQQLWHFCSRCLLHLFLVPLLLLLRQRVHLQLLLLLMLLSRLTLPLLTPGVLVRVLSALARMQLLLVLAAAAAVA